MNAAYLNQAPRLKTEHNKISNERTRATFTLTLAAVVEISHYAGPTPLVLPIGHRHSLGTKAKQRNLQGEQLLARIVREQNG